MRRPRRPLGKRGHEPFAAISGRQARKEPWVVLNIPEEKWRGLRPRTRGILERDARSMRERQLHVVSRHASRMLNAIGVKTNTGRIRDQLRGASSVEDVGRRLMNITGKDKRLPLVIVRDVAKNMGLKVEKK